MPELVMLSTAEVGAVASKKYIVQRSDTNEYYRPGRSMDWVKDLSEAKTYATKGRASGAVRGRCYFPQCYIVEIHVVVHSIVEVVKPRRTVE